MPKKALVMVIDALGVPTLDYLLQNYQGEVNLPNLTKLGLKDIVNSDKIKPKRKCKNSLAEKVDQASATPDSVIGHREMMGVIDGRKFPLYPNGFSKGYISALEKRLGKKTIFNKMSGGEKAIEKNWQRHEKTSELIVYSSKCDPCIQIAMGEKIIPVKEQHHIVEEALKLAQETNLLINRAIARPYVREGTDFTRTNNRHDAVLPIEQKTLIDLLNEKNVYTVAVGKTANLVPANYNQVIKNPEIKDKINFVHPKKKDSNPYNIQGTLNALRQHQDKDVFIFTNLVDTDSLYGHTRDIEGAIKSLEEIDCCLPLIFKELKKDDILIITADHGMEHREDYGYHSKEALPLLTKNCQNLKFGDNQTLADVGYLVAQQFDCDFEFANECNLKQYYRDLFPLLEFEVKEVREYMKSEKGEIKINDYFTCRMHNEKINYSFTAPDSYKLAEKIQDLYCFGRDKIVSSEEAVSTFERVEKDIKYNVVRIEMPLNSRIESLGRSLLKI